MRKLALWLLLAGFAAMACAATRMTVGQVEQLLSASNTLSDAKLAAKISGLELVERASSARLARWQNDFPGKRTREALLVLADASSFLDLPPAEILPKASPDSAALSETFQRAIAYVNTTIKKLPNFSARRSTTQFDDVSPMQRLRNQSAVDPSRGFQKTLAPGSMSSSSASLLRFGDPVSAVVTYRDGEEVVDTEREKGKKAASPVVGLTTYGEFGPILSVTTGDAMKGKVYWSHWEQGATGPLAVFRFLVHQEDSHFSVIGGGNMSRYPSYHGEIAVDPATGTILRATLVSDWKPPFQPSISAMMVEYGPVQIGNATYICPIKGVALSKVPTDVPGNGGGELDRLPHQTFVNDVSFTDYHVFRGEVRILP